MATRPALVLLLILAVTCEAERPQGLQAPPASAGPTKFDVVSIKQNKSGQRSSRYGFNPNGFEMTNVPLKRLIMFAFNLRSDKFISGLPSWTDSVNFDIEAKLDEDELSTLKRLPPTEAQQDRYIMLQQMLFERFKFKIHHEKREFPAYGLIVDKGGPQLSEAGQVDDTKPSGSHDGELFLKASPLSVLALTLSHYLDREVVDETGLAGTYNISLKWASRASLEQQSNGAPAPVLPSIFTAVREQLGLRLVPTRSTSAEMTVVDNIEMPTEN